MFAFFLLHANLDQLRDDLSDIQKTSISIQKKKQVSELQKLLEALERLDQSLHVSQSRPSSEIRAASCSIKKDCGYRWIMKFIKPYKKRGSS